RPGNARPPSARTACDARRGEGRCRTGGGPPRPRTHPRPHPRTLRMRHRGRAKGPGSHPDRRNRPPVGKLAGRQENPRSADPAVAAAPTHPRHPVAHLESRPHHTDHQEETAVSIWTSIPEGAQTIAAATGLPGDEPLEVDVAIAPSFHNRTRIAAWNGETG